MHEAGHELDRVVIARAGEHAEPPEDLEPHPVVLDHVELRPVLGRRDLGPLHQRRRIHPDGLGRGPLADRPSARAAARSVVFAVDAQRHRQREVVDAREHRVEILPCRSRARGSGLNVAPTHSLQSPTVFTSGLARDRPAERGERVGDVHEPGVGRDRLRRRVRCRAAPARCAARAGCRRARRCRRWAGGCRTAAGSRCRAACCRSRRPRSTVMTKSAPASACLPVELRPSTVMAMPRRLAISPPSSSMSFSRSASRSCSTTSAPCERRSVGEVAQAGAAPSGSCRRRRP